MHISLEKKNLIERISVLAFFSLLLCVIFIAPSFAADTASVTATVTAQNLSVSVNDGTITYGTLGVGSTYNTTNAQLNDSQFALNDGNITSKFSIRGQNSANWTLQAAAGSNQYTHEWCTSNCDSSPTWSNLTTNYQTLTASIGVGISTPFDLQIGTPTSTTFYTAQSVDVTVQVTTP